MNVGPFIDSFQQLLIVLIAASFQTEAHESKNDRRRNFEPAVLHKQFLKLVGEFDMMPNMFLEFLHPVDPEYEPQLE